MDATMTLRSQTDSVINDSFSGISLDTTDLSDISTDIDWLKKSAKRKDLKVSGQDSTMIQSPQPFHSIRKSLSPKNSNISTDFECVKIAALNKGHRTQRIMPIEICNNGSSLSYYNDPAESRTNKTNKYKDENTERGFNSTNNVSTRSGIVFSTKKLLLENELLRRENVKKAMERRKEDMENFSRDLKHKMVLLRTIQAQKRQQEQMDECKRLEAEEEQMNDLIRQNEIRRKREQQVQVQRIQECKEKAEYEQVEYRKIIKEKEEMEELLEKIQPCSTEFYAKYENINTLVTLCKDRNSAIAALTPYYETLKELARQMEVIDKKMRAGNITLADSYNAEDIVRRTDEVVIHYKAEIEHIDNAFETEIARREYEYKQAALQLQAQTALSNELENRQLQQHIIPSDQPNSVAKEDCIEAVLPPVEHLPEPQSLQVATVESAAQDELQRYVNTDLWQIYVQSKAYLDQYQIMHQEFLNNDALKKFRFDCRKAIITPVNAINAINREYLTDKFDRVHNFLTGKLMPNVLYHPQGISFSLHTLAKKIVSQGDTLVSSKPEMSFGVAAFAVAICNEYPEFSDMLLAHFRVACPYVIPLWLPQLEPEENTDKQDYNNIKKNSGILRLYAAIIVTRPRQGVTKSHPHGLGNAWKWLAATLNIEPRVETVEIISTLLLVMLEVVGHFMLSSYPTQFPKMLNALRSEYFPQLKSLGNDAGGPVTRLEEFVEKSVTTGIIPPPTGFLPPNYW